jgi:hypothetical protein
MICGARVYSACGASEIIPKIALKATKMIFVQRNMLTSYADVVNIWSSALKIYGESNGNLHTTI